MKSSDTEFCERTSVILTETNANLLRKATFSATHIVNRSIDNYFTFNLTLYIIIHRISNRFHIGFYEDHEPHDLHWHHIYSTGSGTVGDALRREGFGRFKIETIGKFSSMDHLIRTFRFYHRRMLKQAKPYEAFRDDDNLEVFLKTYSKSIGKDHAKKEKTKKIRE